MIRRGSYVTLKVGEQELVGRVMSGCINECSVNVRVKYYKDRDYITVLRSLSDVRAYNGGCDVFIPLDDIDERDE